MKFVPRWLAFGWMPMKKLSKFDRWLSICGKIVSSFTQPAHAKIFGKNLKAQLKCDLKKRIEIFSNIN
jgi:hypothetical protein